MTEISKIREIKRVKRHIRIRTKIKGDKERLRLSVHRSLRNLSVQLIDDVEAKTVLSASTLDKEIKQKFHYGGNVKAASFLGEVFAQRAKEKGINQAVLDRGGYLYHGRLKALAEGLRKGGLIL